jgi:hypothetical protein
VELQAALKASSLWMWAALACASSSAREPSTLFYRTVEPVDDAVAMQMTAVCGAWARARPPWREAFHAHASRGSVGDGKPKQMFGRVTLTLGEYEPQVGQFRTVDPGDEALVAYADARWAVSQLEAWARLYRVTWDVEFDGVRGRVRPAGLDSAAARVLAGMYERAGRPAEGRVEILRAAIDRKYSDRR